MHYYLYAKTDSNQVIPWLIDEFWRCQIEACIFEILIPSGLSNQFQFSHTEMFHQSGILRSTSVIQIATVLMKLILTIHPFDNKEYRYFYRMAYEDLNQLMSPVFKTEKSILNLQNKLLELICLSQGLFPPSEGRLIHHQLYCLSNYLITGGSILNFWAVSGERMMKALKICVPDGGKKFDFTTIKKYSSHENDKLKNVYSNDSFFTDGNNSFTKIGDFFWLDNFKFELLKNSNKVVTFQDKINSFLLSLVVIVKKIFGSFEEAINKSKLYSLFINYRSIGNASNIPIKVDIKNSTFFEYIKFISKKEGHSLNQFCVNLINYLYNRKIVKYCSAMIHGTEFPIRDYENDNDMFTDDLISQWNTSGSYSSWFKCLDYYNLKMLNNQNDGSFGYHSWCNFSNSKANDNKLNQNKDRYLFGQFNYFFKVDESFPDSNLHGSHIGCALTRYPIETDNDNYFVNFIQIRQYNNNLNQYFDNSLNKDIYFIDLEDVVPTRIMILGMDELKKPIRNRIATRSTTLDNLNLYSVEKIPSLLFFIELDESKRYVMKGTGEIDEQY